ncbi:M48 family metalloprotease [Patescibacteria group bacterium]|jgi:heat shock protein HtpX|nr:M48 family metalloprotease [Patescibacteria group bacterium]
MATLYTHQSQNIRKTWFLMSAFFIVVIGIAWAVSWFYDNQLILWIAVAIALVMNVGSYWFSHKLVVKMTGAHPADPREYRELHRIVENLAITAGLPKPDVYVINDPAPNAFATGRDPEHAVVAFTTGLLSMLERSEIEGVAAHELAHVGNRDMLVATVAVVLAGFIAIIADIFMRSLWFGVGGRDNRAGGIILIIGIVLAILAPIAAAMIQTAISRKREYLADASGALLTRYPEGLASALEKISSANRPMQRQSHATAHLFIANPFGSGRGFTQNINRLFQTHPPAEERIAILRAMQV